MRLHDGGELLGSSGYPSAQLHSVLSAVVILMVAGLCVDHKLCGSIIPGDKEIQYEIIPTSRIYVT